MKSITRAMALLAALAGKSGRFFEHRCADTVFPSGDAASTAVRYNDHHQELTT